MTNYDRMFLKNITELVKPLYRLLGKGKKFEWCPSDTEAFKALPEKWSKRLELFIPDEGGLFELETDASDVGLGAVLRQDTMPVAYISRCHRMQREITQ